MFESGVVVAVGGVVMVGAAVMYIRNALVNATDEKKQKPATQFEAENKSVEKINEDSSVQLLRSALEAKRVLKELVEESVTTGEATHDALLNKLWKHLQPNIERKERISKLWNKVGFQGTDPSTDFRGMGLLALKALARIATHHPEVVDRCLREDGDQYCYFFAIAGINLCQTLYTMLLQHGILLNMLFQDSMKEKEHYVNTFAAALADTWIQFDTFYIQEISKYIAEGGIPELAIMQFENIRNKFTPHLEERWITAANSQTSTFFLRMERTDD